MDLSDFVAWHEQTSHAHLLMCMGAQHLLLVGQSPQTRRCEMYNRLRPLENNIDGESDFA